MTEADSAATGSAKPLLEQALSAQLQAQAAPANPWVRGGQLALAAACIAIAGFIGIWLVVDGQPAPQAAPVVKGHSAGKGGTSGHGAGQGAGNSGTSDHGAGQQQAAEVNEQTPWAFAIAALVIAAFIAVGQSMSFGGSPPSEESDASDQGGGGDQ
jgi:hypothetical protein